MEKWKKRGRKWEREEKRVVKEFFIKVMLTFGTFLQKFCSQNWGQIFRPGTQRLLRQKKRDTSESLRENVLSLSLSPENDFNTFHLCYMFFGLFFHFLFIAASFSLRRFSSSFYLSILHSLIIAEAFVFSSSCDNFVSL